MYMRLIAKSLKTQPLHSPFADNIYHFWRLSKKYPHLFFHPSKIRGNEKKMCDPMMLQTASTSKKMPFEPPWRPLRNAPVDTIKGRITWFWHQRRGHILGRSDPLPIAFTGLSVVNSLYTAIPKRTSLVSYFVQSQFVISTKKLAVCLVADDVGEGYYSVRTPRENGRKTHRDHRGQWWKSAITRPLWPRFVDRCNVVSRTYGSPRW